MPSKSASSHYNAPSHDRRIYPSRLEAGQEVRLACQSCHRRKIKCDKLSPCANCEKSGVVCIPVQRARLPRGRTLKSLKPNVERESELRDRVSRLEQLIGNPDAVEARNHDNAITGSTADQLQVVQHIVAGTEGANITGYQSQSPDPVLKPSLFMNHIFPTRQQIPRLQGNASAVVGEPDRGLVDASTCAGNPSSNLASLTELQINEQLLRLFFIQVDPVIKIIHQPSLTKYLLEGKPYLKYDPLHPAPAALAAAVRLTSVSSLSNEQCAELFATSKESMVSKYQKAAEDALARVDFVITNDMTVLQAFVLCLVATQCLDRSQRVWTMLSMALRIGQAISLHLHNPSFPLNIFEREMRKRLWHAIGLLDIQASLDRASEPMMKIDWLQSLLPSNLNDDDIENTSETIPPLTETNFTDTTFTLILCHSQSAIRSLNFNDFTEPVVSDIHIREQVVTKFQQTALRLLSECQPKRLSFHWYTERFTAYMHALLQLIAVRPLQRHPNFTPPKIRDSGLLKLAVKVLETNYEISSDPRGIPWRWFGKLFFPWHALAVAIAEICGQRDPVLFQSHWPLIEQAYDYFEGLEADPKQAVLWQPMKNLMKRAQVQKDSLLSTAPETMTVVSELASDPTMLFNVNQYESELASRSLEATFNTMDMYSNVFDLMDFGNMAEDFLSAAAWSNYESFIDDIHESGYPTLAQSGGLDRI